MRKGMVLSGPGITPVSVWAIWISGLLDSRQVCQYHSFFPPITVHNDLIQLLHVTEIGCTVTEGEYLCAGNDVTMDTSQATKGRHVTRW